MIPSEYFWSNILLIAAGTIAIRGSIIAISARVKITERQKEIFTFIPAAILPALTLPMVAFHQGQSQLLHGKERLFVLILATGLCWLTRNLLITIIFGLLLLRYLSGN